MPYQMLLDRSRADLTALGTFWVDAAPSRTAATAILLAAAALLDRLLARRASPRMRALLYVAVLARAALPTEATVIGLPSWPVPHGSDVSVGTTSEITRRSSAATPVSTVENSRATSRRDLDRATARPTSRLPSLVGIVYLLGVFLLLGRIVLARVRLARAIARAAPAPDDVSALVPGVAVRTHPALGPMAAGMFRATIILPATELLALTRAELALILAHEVAHVRRRDLASVAALQICCVVLWPIVPVWFAARRIRLLLEVACDEVALAGADAGTRRVYGELLLKLAGAERPAAASPIVPSFGWELLGRLRALRCHQRWPRRVQIAVTMALVSTGLATTGVAQPERTDAPLVRRAMDEPPQAASRLVTGPRGGLFGRLKDVRQCYNRVLDSGRRVYGPLAVRFQLDADGKIVDASAVKVTFDAPDLVACALEALRSATFRGTGNPVTATFPLILGISAQERTEVGACMRQIARGFLLPGAKPGAANLWVYLSS